MLLDKVSSQQLEKVVVGDSLPHAASRVTTAEPARGRWRVASCRRRPFQVSITAYFTWSTSLLAESWPRTVAHVATPPRLGAGGDLSRAPPHLVSLLDGDPEQVDLKEPLVCLTGQSCGSGASPFGPHQFVGQASRLNAGEAIKVCNRP
jgi:hypothetical protein